MNDSGKIGRSLTRSRWGGALSIALALTVLGATLAWSAWDLRARIRGQIVHRDAEIFDAVTLMQHLNDQAAGETIATLKDPGEQFQLALKVSRLRNVLGVRLYSSTGKFVNAFPAYITEAALPAADLKRLQGLEPVSRFSAQSQLQEQDMLSESTNAAAALLFVDVPLRADNHPGQPRLAGIIQFLTDGSSVARQFADLDRNLILKFSAAFLVGAVILSVGLGLALHRVQRANQKLLARTDDLLQANRELALAARTSAVGAVAAHLIHGLKNPLTGLRHFVRAHQEEAGVGEKSEWQLAAGTAQRMEDLINRVVRVLQEQQSGVEYEISLAELAGLLAPKAEALAATAGVRWETRMECSGTLSNREADLILLILENLVQNAVEATPPGKTVHLDITGAVNGIAFVVSDQGPGFPAALRSHLFVPCISGKQGGGGIGLAISRQLAQSMGARLELAASGPEGCRFRLVVSTLRPDPLTPEANKKVSRMSDSV